MVWLGVVVGMVAIGALVAPLSLGLGSVLRVIVPLADLLLIALGLLLLFGRNPFTRLPQVSPAALGVAGRWPAHSCTACCSRQSRCRARGRS